MSNLFPVILSSMRNLFLTFLLILSLSVFAHADITTGLVGWWRFDEGSGVSTEDRSGKGNAGDLTGHAPSWATGIRKGALSFNGSTYVQVANSSSLAVIGDITITAWVNLVNYTTYNGIVGKTNGAIPASYDYYICQNGDGRGAGKIAFFRGNGAAWGEVDGTAVIPIGVWSFIAVTMSGTTVTHYLNGAANGSGTLSTTVGDGGGSLLIGSRADSATFMNGLMDDVRIYNRALTASDVYSLFLSDNRIRNATMRNVQFK